MRSAVSSTILVYCALLSSCDPTATRPSWYSPYNMGSKVALPHYIAPYEGSIAHSIWSSPTELATARPTVGIDAGAYLAAAADRQRVERQANQQRPDE